MTESQILLVNLLLYAAGIPFFIKRCGLVSIATFAWFVYFLCALCSYFYFLSPLYDMLDTEGEYIVQEGMWYLFAVNFLLCYLLRLFTFSKTNIIKDYNPDLVRKIQLFLVVMFGIMTLTTLPQAISNLLSGRLSDLRDLTYEHGAGGGLTGFLSYINRLIGGLSYLLLIIPLFHILILKKVNSIDKLSLVIFLCSIVSTMGLYISRSIVVTMALFVLITIIMAYRYLNAKFVKWMMIVAVPVMFVTIGIFSAITSSRFGQSDSDSESEQFANLRYAGESMINFMALMYDKTYEPLYGYKQFQLFRRGLGLSYYGENATIDRDVANEKLDEVHPYPNYIFYTAMGDVYIEWGKWIPLFFLLGVNIWIHFLRRRDQNKFNFFYFIFGTYLGYLITYGVFYLDFMNESGNMIWVYMVILYILLSHHQMIIGITKRDRLKNLLSNTNN